MPRRIISLDGGGIRGVLTARLLSRLVHRHPELLSRTELFAGTSTGGILALALADGRHPDELVDLYARRGRAIFADSPLDDLADAGTLLGAQYAAQPLASELTRIFGTRMLADLRARVAITAFDLAPPGPDKPGYRPKVFENFDHPGSDADRMCVDVALATSAAPTYFPAHGSYIDGGVFANNPALVALAQMLDPRAGAARLEEVVLLSIGTGAVATRIEHPNADWGLVRWARPIVDILVDGASLAAEFQARQLLGPRTFRLNPPLPGIVPMDDWHHVGDLLKLAEAVSLDDLSAWVEEFWS